MRNQTEREGERETERAIMPRGMQPGSHSARDEPRKSPDPGQQRAEHLALAVDDQKGSYVCNADGTGALSSELMSGKRTGSHTLAISLRRGHISYSQMGLVADSQAPLRR